MSTAGTVNGTAVTIPTAKDTNNGATFTALLQALVGACSTIFDMGIASGLAASTTSYCGPGNNGATSTELLVRFPKAGKLSNLYAIATSAVVGDSLVIRVKTGSTSSPSNSSLTCTIAASGTTAADTTNTVTVAAGDYMSISATPGGSYSSGGANLRVSLAFTPS
jgi:hypothetical protein